MKLSKQFLGGAAVLAASAAAAFNPMQVTDVLMTQDDFHETLTITYTLTADDAAFVRFDILTNDASIGTENLQTVSGDGYSADFTSLVTNGTHQIVWRAKKDWPQHFSTNVQARVVAYYTNRLDQIPGIYMVVDLSKGTAATASDPYPVTYTFTAPTPLTDDSCLSNQLWLKRIESGTFTMGCATNEPGHYGYVNNETTRSVTIKKAFFAGVFPVTRAQYQLMMGGTAPGIGSLLAPVNQVSYDTLRGSTNVGINWPDTTNQVTGSSFFGILRSRTGNIEFDLPTQAQWEYACRSGTTNGCWNDGSAISETTLRNLGWYKGNSAIGGTLSIHPVGQKKPSLWGLYDMHGNSWDWCLDWWKAQTLVISHDSSEGDRGYVGLANGAQRAIKGGGWSDDWQDCRSARSWAFASNDATSQNVGFRLFVTLP